jgi:hypothetical protein
MMRRREFIRLLGGAAPSSSGCDERRLRSHARGERSHGSYSNCICERRRPSGGWLGGQHQ